MTSLPVDSSFVTEVGVYDDTFTRLFFLMNDEPPGVSITFNPFADLGIAAGHELIVGIRVVTDGNREYFLGPGSRNPDGVIHGMIDTTGSLVVSFEDWFGGGDVDYNDAVFRFEGGIEPVPEPGSLALLVLGFGGLRLASRRRS